MIEVRGVVELIEVLIDYQYFIKDNKKPLEGCPH